MIKEIPCVNHWRDRVTVPFYASEGLSPLGLVNLSHQFFLAFQESRRVASLPVNSRPLSKKESQKRELGTVSVHELSRAMVLPLLYST